MKSKMLLFSFNIRYILYSGSSSAIVSVVSLILRDAWEKERQYVYTCCMSDLVMLEDSSNFTSLVPKANLILLFVHRLLPRHLIRISNFPSWHILRARIRNPVCRIVVI
jgi:hypothetical protein